MGEGPEASGRTAVVIATNIDVIELMVTSAGYAVVGAAVSAVNGETLLQHLVRKDRAPDVVVVENDLVGPTGWDAIPGLRAASPATQVLLVVNENWTPRDSGPSGAFAVVSRSRLSELVTELDGVDRRLHQDWSKLGRERRVERSRAA